jgi:quercetin dioxygenase-like cupin family protein
MGFTHLPFPHLEWQTGVATDLERKKAIDPVAAALLEFAPGFVDPQWCERGHVGLVLEGELSFDLDGSQETLSHGEGFVIDAGTRHRASNRGEVPCRLFIVSDGP